ncbi:hypothetical protein [Oerskovia jenensis]|uniref:hypothetical protein n=1 Tax=Oerskovia jenensis TaxID=162169 RepID=UPI0036DC0B6C
MRKTTTACVVALSMVGLLSTPASAAEQTPSLPSEDAGAVTLTAIDAATIATAADAPITSDEAQAVNDHLASQANAGRLLDAGDVTSADVGDATIVWEHGVAIESLEVATEIGEGGAVDQEVALVTTANPDAEGSAASSTGLGLAAAGRYSGAAFKGGDCYTTFTTLPNAKNNKVTGCWEKFKIDQSTPTRDYWYYGRWATANGGTGASTKPAYIDIRARPWAGSTAVAGLVNYWPKNGNTICSGGSSTSFGYAGFSATIPVQQCSEITPIPNATKKEMGVIYDQGWSYSGVTRGADFGMAVSTFKGAVPSFADYNYVKFCNASAGCANAHGNLRKDAGW